MRTLHVSLVTCAEATVGGGEKTTCLALASVAQSEWQSASGLAGETDGFLVPAKGELRASPEYVVK